ncbi:uncharacterized protein LOC124172072 [Ischnura elegans]|uniref:uncharacterized protein LOC124172072 n=1 Tax=Ischnura elegans TaxID=197161 RepID=UPI001ED88432|nr:uncharacterized protein LOC124172072 [Ischnura elegans]
MAKCNGKRNLKICFEEEPHALVKYLDREGNKEIVPVCNIPELKAPDFAFDKKAVYDVFWAPSKKSKAETLTDYRRLVSEIPRFPAGSGNDCGPGFYPATVLIVCGNKKDLLMKMEVERLKEPSRKILDFMCSNGERNREDGEQSSKGKGTGGRRKKIGVPRPAVPAGTSESSDDSDPGVIPVTDYRREMKIREEMEEKYEDVVKRYRKTREENISLQKQVQSGERRIAELECRLLDVLRLNIENQKHMLKCSRVGSQEDGVPEERNGDASFDGMIADRVGDKPKTPPSAVISSHSPALVATVEELSVPEERNSEMESLTKETENANTETATSVVDDSKVEIYPRIGICKEVFSCTSFRNFLENPLKTYRAGAAGDREFIRDATHVLWNDEELAKHTVTGKQSNAYKTSDKALPALCERRIEAILGALHRRVAMEEEAGGMEGSVAGRVVMAVVKKEIGAVMHNVKKRMRRAQGTGDINGKL